LVRATSPPPALLLRLRSAGAAGTRYLLTPSKIGRYDRFSPFQGK